jgi:hypothetical protein
MLSRAALEKAGHFRKMPSFFFKRLKLDQLFEKSGIFPENGRVFSTKTAY